MTDKTDSKEREALIRAITSMCHDMDNDKIIITRREGEGPALRKLLDAMQRELASLAASAGSEPVAWRYVDARGHFRYVGYKPSRDMAAEYPLLKPIRLYLHPSPPEGMVGGWIASKDQMPPPGVRVFWGDVDSNRVGYDFWAGDDYRWTPSHWMHIPEFPAPPTTTAGSGKGE